ncbi:MAG TPA: BON domain-containing protein [Chitinophagaceae bacterium]|nr:BON domain-containing protein [Chitinophagaceae bacterium]
MKLKHLTIRSLAFALALGSLVACNDKTSDADIQTEVNKKLADEAGSGLTASVSNGVVTLSGNCKNDECRRSCAAEIKDVKGVKSVVNNINVAVAAPVEIATDTALQQGVNAAVQAYKDVKAEVNDGVITLRGEIERDKLQDLMMALNALKPKKIENQLAVK